MRHQHADYLDQPYEISLETLALCNAACVFCPYPTLERKGTKMPDVLVYRLIHEMTRWEHPFFFAPFKVNEPFLDKRLIEFCTVATETTKARLRLFTNGTPLTPDLITSIASLQQVEHLWVSLNAHEADDYERIMSLPFDRTCKRLDDLHSRVLWGAFPHPVVLSKVTTGSGDREFWEFCKARWPHFVVRFIKQDGWLGYVPPANPTIPDAPCLRWYELSIMASGVVSLCCMDGKGDFPIGNIREQSLLEVYNSPAWRDRRERQLSRKEVHPCATCTY
jgi:MoaA/NifB/PqqE/SkfB family radical SAM enzyme